MHSTTLISDHHSLPKLDTGLSHILLAMDPDKTYYCCPAHTPHSHRYSAYINNLHCGQYYQPDFYVKWTDWTFTCHKTLIFDWCPALTIQVSDGPKPIQRPAADLLMYICGLQNHAPASTLILDSDDFHHRDILEVLEWNYCNLEMHKLNFGNSMMVAWNAILMADGLGGPLEDELSALVFREDALDYLTQSLRECFKGFSLQNRQQRLRSMLWVRRLWGPHEKRCEDLKQAVIEVADSFYGEMRLMWDGVSLLDSYDDFKQGVEKKMDEIHGVYVPEPGQSNEAG